MLKDIAVSVISGIICTVLLETARSKKDALLRRSADDSNERVPAPHAAFNQARQSAPTTSALSGEYAEEPEVMDVVPVNQEELVGSAGSGTSPQSFGGQSATATASRPAKARPRSAKRDNSPHFAKRMASSVMRILMAVGFGFFGSAFVAGMMEGAGHDTIEFGSSLMIVLMILCCGAAWIVVSQLGRQREH